MEGRPVSTTPTTVSKDEAQSALKDIEKTESRTAAFRHGEFAAPHLIVWGVVWGIGYLVSYFQPAMSWIWAPLVLAGVAASFLFDRRQSGPAIKGFSWRYGLSFVVLFVFIFALFAVMKPRELNQVAAFYPLVIGLYYTFMGIWTKGWRMLPLGLALMALTMIGYFFLPEYFVLWMAGVGGGGLILGGLWMRSA
jgi:hypothetical protein